MQPTSLFARSFIAASIAASMAIPALGCGLLRRRTQVNSTVNSSVQVNSQGRDLATLTRDEYEIIETSVGESKHTGVLIVTIPVGQQTTAEEGAENAYYAAVDRIPECDTLLTPRVSVKRTIIPLLLVNIVIRKTRVKGRCAHFKGKRSGVANERGIVAAESDKPADATVPRAEPAPASAGPAGPADAAAEASSDNP